MIEESKGSDNPSMYLTKKLGKELDDFKESTCDKRIIKKL